MSMVVEADTAQRGHEILSYLLWRVVPFKSVIRFNLMYELVGTNHDRLKVLWRESFVVGSEDHDSVGCINELLDWKTHRAFHCQIIYTAFGVGLLG
jgi:hypothetical protein